MKESRAAHQKAEHILAGIIIMAACAMSGFIGESATAASITLTVPGRLTLSAVADGAFHESATAATVSVKSDAYSGYTLGVKSGESSKPALKNGSNTIPSISSAMAGSSFPVNTWGWLPSKLGGQANSQYQPGPTSTLVTIEKTASPNASTANSYTIKLGAKVNGTIPAGTYVNTFTFTATANPVPYNISYNTNGAGTVNGTSGSAVEGTQITLANAPTKSGYEFKGWCTVSTSNETCPSTGKSYTAGGKYALTNSANSVTFYAMWLDVRTHYSITYNLNGGKDGPDPNPQTGATTAATLTLDSKKPTKDGYTFQYWCSASNTSSPTTCSGTHYDAGATYTLSSGANTTLYAVWKQDTYSIKYELNGGTGGPDPNPQTGAITGTKITLDRKPPTKSGHTFQYWCSASNTSNSTTCSGTHYDAGATYTLSSGANTTLYAVWRKNVDLGSLGNMQSFSCSKITSIGDYGTVTDTRDNNTYRVRKLVDGKCWMIDNLRLGDSKLQNRTLTSANTDLNGIASYKLPNSSTSGFRREDATAQNIYVVETDSGNELKTYGGYYTYNAATAGTGASITSYDNASSSICPKGWKLPTAFPDDDFWTLNNKLGGVTNSDAHLINPDGPAFLRAGMYWVDEAFNQGDRGQYWTSSKIDSRLAFMIFLSSTNADPGSNTDQYMGFSVRCIAR